MEEEKRRYLKPFDPNHQYYAKAELAFDRELLYPWRYKEAVGRIRLHILGTQSLRRSENAPSFGVATST